MYFYTNLCFFNLYFFNFYTPVHTWHGNFTRYLCCINLRNEEFDKICSQIKLLSNSQYFSFWAEKRDFFFIFKKEKRKNMVIGQWRAKDKVRLALVRNISLYVTEVFIVSLQMIYFCNYNGHVFFKATCCLQWSKIL